MFIRIHSSLSSSAADAGRSTSHSQRPCASPANTDRSKVAVGVAGEHRPQRDRVPVDPHLGERRPLADLRARGRCARTPAQRAPRPDARLLGDHGDLDDPVEVAGPATGQDAGASLPVRRRDGAEVGDGPARVPAARAGRSGCRPPAGQVLGEASRSRRSPDATAG